MPVITQGLDRDIPYNSPTFSPVSLMHHVLGEQEKSQCT